MLQEQIIKNFFTDSQASKIISVFYDKDNPIEFTFQKIVDVFGIPASSARRTVYDLLNANCITKKKSGYYASYIITEQNALIFSLSVRNSQNIKQTVYPKVSIDRRKRYLETKRLEKIAERSKPSASRPERCANCGLYYSWMGLANHRKKCYKKPLSFVRT